MASGRYSPSSAALPLILLSPPMIMLFSRPRTILLVALMWLIPDRRVERVVEPS
jgi:hypothetical protein